MPAVESGQRQQVFTQLFLTESTPVPQDPDRRHNWKNYAIYRNRFLPYESNKKYSVYQTIATSANLPEFMSGYISILPSSPLGEAKAASTLATEKSPEPKFDAQGSPLDHYAFSSFPQDSTILQTGNEPIQSPCPTKAVQKKRSKKRTRTAFSSHQLMEMEREFHILPYVCRARRIALSTSLGLSERQIKIWFQNRRMKKKKEEESKAAATAAKTEAASKVEATATVKNSPDYVTQDEAVGNRQMNYYSNMPPVHIDCQQFPFTDVNYEYLHGITPNYASTQTSNGQSQIAYCNFDYQQNPGIQHFSDSQYWNQQRQYNDCAYYVDCRTQQQASVHNNYQSGQNDHWDANQVVPDFNLLFPQYSKADSPITLTEGYENLELMNL